MKHHNARIPGRRISPKQRSDDSASLTPFIITQSVDPNALESQDVVLQSVLKLRKGWKSLSGSEVVWPPELEVALLEGLEEYEPDDSLETRLLGRFPMRNRFIADYIFNKTGKRRTSKQVGSRLQQLRDVIRSGGRYSDLLKPRRRMVGSSARTSDFLRDYGHILKGLPSPSITTSCISSTPAPDFQFSEQGEMQEPAAPHTVVYIDLLSESEPADSLPSSKSAGSTWPPASPSQVFEPEEGANVVHISTQPRCIHTIDPTITFLSESSVSSHSYFVIYLDGCPVSSDTSPLTAVKPPPDVPAGSLLYSTSLVPSYWGTILSSPDPTRYTIAHQVIQDPVPSMSQSTLFSALYKFQYSQTPDQGPTLHAADREIPTALSTTTATPHDQQYVPLDNCLPDDPPCSLDVFDNPELGVAYHRPTMDSLHTEASWALASSTFGDLTFEITAHVSSLYSLCYPRAVVEKSYCVF